MITFIDNASVSCYAYLGARTESGLPAGPRLKHGQEQYPKP